MEGLIDITCQVPLFDSNATDARLDLVIQKRFISSHGDGVFCLGYRCYHCYRGRHFGQSEPCYLKTMCIALISTAHPDYALVLINNRDVSR